MRPEEYRPQLAQLAAHPPSGPKWVHELKLDGYRAGLFIDGRDVRLMSRRGSDFGAEFPEIIVAAKKLKVQRAVIDGEIVMLSKEGATSFQNLQNRAWSRKGLTFFAFDLLSFAGKLLTQLTLEDRKARLRKLIQGDTGVIRYSPHFEADGSEVLRQACELGAEGIISKRRDSRYRLGARHSDWQKIKCSLRQEFVVGGFTDPTHAVSGVGSIMLGYYRDGKLAFAGKVSNGPGWGDEFGRKLRARLEKIEQLKSPFNPVPPGWIGRNAHWVKPQLVAEVEFTEWTQGGHVRHPSLQGFRSDKRPTDVVRETSMPQIAPAPAKGRAAAIVRSAPKTEDDAEFDFELIAPEELVYPKARVRKEDIVRFYIDMCDHVLPHMAGRPLTLVRRTGVITRADALRTQAEFRRHAASDQSWVPSWIPRVAIPEKKKVGHYLYIDSLRALIALINVGVAEFHVWNAPAGDFEHPDRVVFDIDPGEGVPWTKVVAAAERVRDELAALDLESWVKTTGGKGLHVVVPFRRGPSWDEAFAFSRAVAQRIVDTEPRVYTLDFDREKRARRILLDYKRNYRTSIAVAGYSTRARPAATLSVPVAWAELGSVDPESFTLKTVRERLSRRGSDPWKGYWSSAQRLPDLGK